MATLSPYALSAADYDIPGYRKSSRQEPGTPVDEPVDSCPDRRADLRKLARGALAERRDGRDADYGDQRHEERVLDQGRTPLGFARPAR